MADITAFLEEISVPEVEKLTEQEAREHISKTLRNVFKHYEGSDEHILAQMTEALVNEHRPITDFTLRILADLVIGTHDMQKHQRMVYNAITQARKGPTKEAMKQANRLNETIQSQQARKSKLPWEKGTDDYETDPKRARTSVPWNTEPQSTSLVPAWGARPPTNTYDRLAQGSTMPSWLRNPQESTPVPNWYNKTQQSTPGSTWPSRSTGPAPTAIKSALNITAMLHGSKNVSSRNETPTPRNPWIQQPKQSEYTGKAMERVQVLDDGETGTGREIDRSIYVRDEERRPPWDANPYALEPRGRTSNQLTFTSIEQVAELITDTVAARVQERVQPTIVQTAKNVAEHVVNARNEDFKNEMQRMLTEQSKKQTEELRHLIQGSHVTAPAPGAAAGSTSKNTTSTGTPSAYKPAAAGPVSAPDTFETLKLPGMNHPVLQYDLFMVLQEFVKPSTELTKAYEDFTADKEDTEAIKVILESMKRSQKIAKIKSYQKDLKRGQLIQELTEMRAKLPKRARRTTPGSKDTGESSDNSPDDAADEGVGEMSQEEKSRMFVKALGSSEHAGHDTDTFT